MGWSNCRYYNTNTSKICEKIYLSSTRFECYSIMLDSSHSTMPHMSDKYKSKDTIEINYGRYFISLRVRPINLSTGCRRTAVVCLRNEVNRLNKINVEQSSQHLIGFYERFSQQWDVVLIFVVCYGRYAWHSFSISIFLALNLTDTKTWDWVTALAAHSSMCSLPNNSQSFSNSSFSNPSLLKKWCSEFDGLRSCSSQFWSRITISPQRGLQRCCHPITRTQLW